MNAKRKRKLQSWIAICLLAVCAAMPLLSRADQETYEGPGWDTPEDAVLHYLEGLKEQDLDQMISAYAVETCIDRFDLEAMLMRFGAYHLSFIPCMPNSSSFLREVNMEARKGEIERSILYQITSICRPWRDFYSSIPFSTEDGGEEIKAFVEGIEGAFNAVDFSTLEFSHFVPLEQVSDLVGSERNQENFKAQMAPYGGEEARSLCAVFVVDNHICVLVCDMVRHGDRWFMHRSGGNIGALLGLDAASGGMVAVPLDELLSMLGDLDKMDFSRQDMINEAIRSLPWFK